MITFGIRMPSIARFFIGAFLVTGGACSSPTSGVGGESQLGLVKDLYFMNTGRVVSDDLWYSIDEPWPGKAACGDALNALNLDVSSCDAP